MTKYRHKAKSHYEEPKHTYIDPVEKKGVNEGMRVSFGSIPV